MRATPASITLALALSGCVPDGIVDEKLPSCGSNQSNGFSGQSVRPAKDEGQGRVSVEETSWNDTGDVWYSFRLLRCATGGQISVDARNSLVDGQNDPADVLTRFVGDYRAQPGFSDAKGFVKALKRAGFEPMVTRASEGDALAECMCKTFYPDVRPGFLGSGN
jgi:hypothetical protein